MLNREEIKNLPQLLTPHELAEAMGISISRSNGYLAAVLLQAHTHKGFSELSCW